MDRFGQGIGDRFGAGEPADRCNPSHAGLRLRHLCSLLLRSVQLGVEEPAAAVGVLAGLAKIGLCLWKGGASNRDGNANVGQPETLDVIGTAGVATGCGNAHSADGESGPRACYARLPRRAGRVQEARTARPTENVSARRSARS